MSFLSEPAGLILIPLLLPLVTSVLIQIFGRIPNVRDGLHMMLWFGEHRYQVELREEQLDIDVAEDGERAEVALGLAFWRDGDRDGAPWWDLRAVVDFERKRSSWRIVRSRDVNHHERGR